MSEYHPIIDADTEAFYRGAIDLVELMRRRMAAQLATMTPEQAAADLRSIASIEPMNEYLTAAHRLEVIARWIEQQARREKEAS